MYMRSNFTNLELSFTDNLSVKPNPFNYCSKIALVHTFVPFLTNKKMWAPLKTKNPNIVKTISYLNTESNKKKLLLNSIFNLNNKRLIKRKA